MRGTVRSITAVTVVVALAVSIAGCSQASKPTIYSHEEAVDANNELFDVLNASIDATGGLPAWRTWASNSPLDERVREGNATGGSECIPTDLWGLAGDPLGNFAGESLHSVNAIDAEAALAAIQKVWAKAGFTTIDRERTDSGVTVRATHEQPSPTLTFIYDGTSKKQKVSLEADSICQSYDYLDDDTLDDSE